MIGHKISFHEKIRIIIPKISPVAPSYLGHFCLAVGMLSFVRLVYLLSFVAVHRGEKQCFTKFYLQL